MKKVNTLEEFLSVDSTCFKSSYVGKDKSCRCGCGGTYIDAYDIKGDSKIKARVSKAKKIIKSDMFVDFEAASDYVNISYGDNKAYTFYYQQ